MPDKLKEIGIKLLDWYQKNKRDLPWRHTKDPYRIWISEIMLQQTRVDTVIDYYHRFLHRFPDVESLAEAKEEEVLSAWKGLGYYSRAKNLHKAAGVIVQQYHGKFPDTYEQVRGLPGIGDYTTGAILSIAFGQPHAAVDGNVLRVTSRLLGLEEDITRDKTKKNIASSVCEMIPKENAGDFSQAIMELGALVCAPVEPLCAQCPVNALCSANLEGKQDCLPIKKKNSKPIKRISYWVAIIQSEEGILMEHRQKETLLGKMWGLPMVERNEHDPPEELLMGKYGLGLEKGKKLGKAKHVFTHQIWEMEAVRYNNILEGTVMPGNLQWIKDEEQDGLAIPTAFQRVLHLVKREEDWEQISFEL